MRKKRAAVDGGDVILLPMKERGRPVLFGEVLDTKVQQYLKKVRKGGGTGVVSARIAMAAGRGICCPVTG